jgi:hypothetical protein
MFGHKIFDEHVQWKFPMSLKTLVAVKVDPEDSAKLA